MPIILGKNGLTMRLWRQPWILCPYLWVEDHPHRPRSRLSHSCWCIRREMGHFCSRWTHMTRWTILKHCTRLLVLVLDHRLLYEICKHDPDVESLWGQEVGPCILLHWVILHGTHCWHQVDASVVAKDYCVDDVDHLRSNN